MENGRHGDNQFEVIVRKKDETFFLYSREWRLLVQGTNLNQAYEKIKDEQKLIVERYRNAGLEHELPGSRSKQPMFALGKALGFDMFATLTKTIIVGSVLGIFVFLGSLSLLNQLPVLHQQIERMTSPSPRVLGKIATRAIEKAARTLEGLTPESREEIRQNLRTIVRDLEPFLSELRPVAGNGPQSTVHQR